VDVLRGDTRVPVVEMMQVTNEQLHNAPRGIATTRRLPLAVRIGADGTGRRHALPRSALASVTST
jgi:hypothetical protein